jgi:hypothetical protein
LRHGSKPLAGGFRAATFRYKLAPPFTREDEMPAIDASRITIEALESYDDMMVECVVTVKNLAPLAMAVWSEVMKELDRRGRMKLISGSYDDIGNVLVQRVR